VLSCKMAELDHDDRADMDGLVHAIIHVSADMRTQAHTHTHTHTHTGAGAGVLEHAHTHKDAHAHSHKTC